MIMPKSRPIRILLVEDNSADARLVAERLRVKEKELFEVEHRDHLYRALARLEGGGIDIILSDLHLPDGWGVDIIRQLRQRAPTIPIVVLTGTYQDEELAMECLQAGAQDYLLKEDIVKGISAQIFLHRVIRYSIERQRLNEELQQAKKKLEEKVAALETLNRVMIGREERIMELKGELERRRGEPSSGKKG